MDCFKPDSVRCERLNALANGSPLVCVDRIRSRESDCVSSAERIQRLPEHSTWENVIEPIGFQGVNEHNIQVAIKFAVLKTVVKQNDLGLMAADSFAGGLCTVAILYVWNSA